MNWIHLSITKTSEEKRRNLSVPVAEILNKDKADACTVGSATGRASLLEWPLGNVGASRNEPAVGGERSPVCGDQPPSGRHSPRQVNAQLKHGGPIQSVSDNRGVSKSSRRTVVVRRETTTARFRRDGLSRNQTLGLGQLRALHIFLRFRRPSSQDNTIEQRNENRDLMTLS